MLAEQRCELRRRLRLDLPIFEGLPVTLERNQTGTLTNLAAVRLDAHGKALVLAERQRLIGLLRAASTAAPTTAIEDSGRATGPTRYSLVPRLRL